MGWRASTLTLRRSFASFASKFGDRETLVFPDATPAVRWTAREFDRELNRLAHGYRAAGFGDGDRVGLMGVNTPEFVAALYATMKLDLVPAVFNPREAGDRLAALGERFDPALVVYDPRFDEEIADVTRGSTTGSFVSLGGAVEGDADEGDAVEATHTYGGLRQGGTAAAESIDDPPEAAITREDTAFVNWSTGTTGVPKGLVWSNEGAVFASVVSAASREARRDDVRIVFSTPGFMGWLYATLPTITAGTKLVFMETFDADRYLELVEAEGATWFGGVSTAVRMILDADPGPDAYDLSSVRAAFYAAEGMDRETIERLRSTVGQPVFSVYAASEGATLTTLGTGLDDPTAFSDHLPLVEARAVELRPGAEKAPPDAQVDVGERGELIIRTPARAERVLDDPERTTKIYRDGWWYSDDVVHRGPNHTFRVVGRADDMIITGGINVFPRTVEESLVAHPDVDAAVVVGVPDDRWGERVVAVVRAATGRAVDVDGLDDHCLDDDRIPRHARPREYYVWGERFPRSPSGKVDTATIRERLDAIEGERPGDG